MLQGVYETAAAACGPVRLGPVRNASVVVGAMQGPLDASEARSVRSWEVEVGVGKSEMARAGRRSRPYDPRGSTVPGRDLVGWEHAHIHH